MISLKNKVALVTGGAQGIGKATAQALIKEGSKVVIVDCDVVAGKQTQKEFKSFGDILFINGNVSSESDVKKIIKLTISHYSKIDILVNNAGKFLEKPITKLTYMQWNEIIATNISSIFLFTKYAAKILKKTKGVIVNIASTRAFMSEPHTEAYAASKGGIVALTHALAISLGPQIRVNSISPGWIETSEWQKSSKKHKAKHSKEDKEQHPVGRVGKPEDVAELILYLVSNTSSFMTGTNIIIDGGMTRKMIYK